MGYNLNLSFSISFNFLFHTIIYQIFHLRHKVKLLLLLLL